MEKDKEIKTIILAAGAGTRMRSEKAKVLHRLAGKSLLEHALDTAQGASDLENIAVIIGHQRDEVKKILPEEVSSYVQEEQLGTGHALIQAEPFYKGTDSTVVVLNGDAPLIRPETIKLMVDEHEKSGNTVTVMTTEFDNPTGYGRIIKEDGKIVKIVEERDASEAERNVKEVNAGTYCFNASVLEEVLRNLKTDNNQNEYYLTDAVEIIKDKGLDVGVYFVEDSTETAAVNSRAQLAEAGRILRDRINSRLMDSGVTIIAPENTYIDSTVEIGKDTVVYPGVMIEGETKIGSDCTIGLNSHIVNAKIADRVQVENSTIVDSSVGEDSVVGPYAYIRPDSVIGMDTKIGDFVEVKNSVIGNGTKASHLTYIGDADVGENVNLGCGTVFVNYDGQNKHRTVVEDNSFIGCNTNLVAPVRVGKNAYTAAGSTITEDVEEDSLAIARNRQVNKSGYTSKKTQKK